MRPVMSLGLNLGPRLSVDDNSTQTFLILLLTMSRAINPILGSKYVWVYYLTLDGEAE